MKLFERDGTRFLPVAALFALLVLAVFADPLVTGRIFSGRDLIAYNHPMEKAIHDDYAAGRLPVWMPEISGGRPLAANPNAGAFYPLRPLLSLVSFPAAARLFPILHWILGGWGVLWLVRKLRVSAGAAWIAAVTYTFSGVGMAEVFFPNVHPGMALLPWAVGVAASEEMSGRRQTVAFGLVFAFEMLAGDVFTTGAALIGCALWIFLETPPARRRRSALALVAGFGLAALAALPQIVATSLWIPRTNRAVLGIHLSEAVTFSVSPWRLTELLVPFPFGDTWQIDPYAVWARNIFRGKSLGLFASLYAGAFAVMAVAITWRLRQAGARFGRVVLVLGVLASVPPSFLPNSWQSLHAPVALRNPEKFAVLIVFALALLSALAADRLEKGYPRPRWLVPVGVLLAALAVGARLAPAAAAHAAATVLGAEPSREWIAAGRLANAFSEAGLLWMCAALGVGLLASRRPAWRVAALVLVSLPAIAANRRIARTFRVDEVLAPTPFARWVAKMDPSGGYRVLGEALFLKASPLAEAHAQADPGYLDSARRTFYWHTHAFWREGTVINFDFDNGDFSRIESVRRLARVASGFSDSDRFFGSLALRFGIRERDQPPLAGYVRRRGGGLQDWDENPGALPAVRMAGRWREAEGASEALGSVAALGPDAIVLETGRRAEGFSRPGRARVRESSSARLVIEAESPDPGWLFVLRPYDGVRSITLDGRPVEAVPAQLAFSAVAVPAGRHTVLWQEEIPGWNVSRFGPALAAAFAMLILWFPQRLRPSARIKT